jgi:hypothetical protein
MQPRVRLVLIATGGILGVYLAVCLLLGFFWSFEPEPFDPVATAHEHARAQGRQPVPGYTTTHTAIALTSLLLDKPGGLIVNDLTPPGLWLDNMPNFENGVVFQLRDLAVALRNDWSRSQSQSTEDPDLVEAQGRYFIDTESWILPAAEEEYSEGAQRLRRYLDGISDPAQPRRQFYARADNLADWLSLVEKRLGGLALRLSRSVAQKPAPVAAAASPAAAGVAAAEGEPAVAGTEPSALPAPRGSALPVAERTSWLERDDIFYEARGQAYALIHLLRAVEHDFADVLADKNARVSLAQIIAELEPALDTIWSPLILNGDGFGFVANHSLVMASYISRANAAIIQLRNLLERG